MLSPLRAARTALGRARGFAPLPWGLDLLLTDACNLRCAYCPFTAELSNGTTRVMADSSKVVRFLDSIAHFRPMVRLIGGEPFLHPEWPAIVASARARSIPVTVVTNGSLIAARAEEIVGSGFAAVGISVDPPEAHDTFRGRGSFAVCENAVRELVRAKERLGSPSPLIEIYTTVHSGSYAHLGAWAERLATWGIDTLRLQHEIWLPRAKRAASETRIREALGDATFFRSEVDAYTRDEPPDVDGAILEEQLRAIANGSHPFGVEIQPPLPPAETVQLYRDAEFGRESARACTLTSAYSFVDPTGRLYPCLSLDMGNVFEQPFERVWNGPKYRAFRRMLRRGRLPLCAHCTA